MIDQKTFDWKRRHINGRYFYIALWKAQSVSAIVDRDVRGWFYKESANSPQMFKFQIEDPCPCCNQERSGELVGWNTASEAKAAVTHACLK